MQARRGKGQGSCVSIGVPGISVEKIRARQRTGTADRLTTDRLILFFFTDLSGRQPFPSDSGRLSETVLAGDLIILAGA